MHTKSKPAIRNTQALQRDLAIALLMLVVVALSGCGGSSSSRTSVGLAGNWQFTMAPPADSSFSGGMLGGFITQSGKNATGQVAYAVSAPTAAQNPCAAGSAPITGTVSGQSVTLTAVAGLQTFKLTGTLSQDGKTMTGTYSSTDGQGCGTAQPSLSWTATQVPSVSGTVQGSFHSTLTNRAFAVSGFLTQGPNVGASSATVIGTLTFQSYTCVPSSTVSVNGQISGDSVVAQIIDATGLPVGLIGTARGSLNSATFSSSTGGGVIQGTGAYQMRTKSCPGANTPGDQGNICLGLNSATACQQPITLTPAALTFPGQFLGTPPTAQSITLTNTDPSGATMNGLTVSLQVGGNSDGFSGFTDFTGLPSFSEQDTCATGLGTPFSLGPQQSCTITVSFAPQQACPWLPSSALPSKCPPFLASSIPSPPEQFASVSVLSPGSADPDNIFVVPVNGLGVSLLQPSTPELDFGAEALGEASQPQTFSFINQGLSPVQILPPVNSCPSTLPRPLTAGSVPGLQVVVGASIGVSGSTTSIAYLCDVDSGTQQANFQLVSDSCSGIVLNPLQSCNVTVVYAPQPNPPQRPLDYFLELNTLQCSGSVTTGCELDSGRFPVELKANLPSPLRMSPGAGLDFGPQARGQISLPLTIVLSNDPNDPNAQTINFGGNVVKGNFLETDNCGTSLASGGSCTMSITFTPHSAAFEQGSVTITYNGGQTQTIYLRGFGQ
jgi:hypothetical protein